MILTPRQREANQILQSQAKHILLDGGSRSGKSALLCRAIVHRAIKAPKSRHAILRFHFKDAKESIGMDTMPAVLARCFPNVPYQLNKSDWYFTLPHGAEIWLGGLDDKDRTEKVLGKEYATIYLNECSQISWTARNMAVTRLAQQCPIKIDGVDAGNLALKMYYDCNPPSKAHWAYQVFYQQRDPDTKKQLDIGAYEKLTLNPRDNMANLPADYIQELERLPARMKRRFLEGVYGEVAPGALWTEELIETHRQVEGEVPDLQRICVAVDPSGSGDTDNAGNDEIGIMVGGLGTDGRGYLLEDLTVKAGPKTWGGVATAAYDRHDADAIICEKNFGGEMVRYVIDSQPRVEGRKRTCKLITASRGKAVRAEPISAMHEQGKIRLVGRFQRLEDELCSMTTAGYVGENSPNRADAFVWLMSELFPGIVKADADGAKPASKSQQWRMPTHSRDAWAA